MEWTRWNYQISREMNFWFDNDSIVDTITILVLTPLSLSIRENLPKSCYDESIMLENWFFPGFVSRLLAFVDNSSSQFTCRTLSSVLLLARRSTGPVDITGYRFWISWIVQHACTTYMLQKDKTKRNKAKKNKRNVFFKKRANFERRNNF